jgi:DNA-binding XRE family transcriptional regulator
LRNAATLAPERFLSQAKLAQRSGVRTVTITRVESERTAPSTRTVRALAEPFRNRSAHGWLDEDRSATV